MGSCYLHSLAYHCFNNISNYCFHRSIYHYPDNISCHNPRSSIYHYPDNAGCQYFHDLIYHNPGNIGKNPDIPLGLPFVTSFVGIDYSCLYMTIADKVFSPTFILFFFAAWDDNLPLVIKHLIITWN